MKTLTTVLIAGLVAVIGAIGFAYSGIYDVGADSPHGGLAAWLLSTTSHASVERRASGVTVPDLSGPELLAAGASDFDAMCAGCHGAPGREPGAVGAGLNPRPPDLAQAALHMTPAELFWVTKHGIKMTGMPAWGVTHDDAALWPVVAFMTRLPELEADAYRSLVASALGHHAHGGGQHDDGDGPADSHDEAPPDGHHHEHDPSDGHHEHAHDHPDGHGAAMDEASP